MAAKPVAIFSKILNDTIYLTETPIPGKACYNAKEVAILKQAEKEMGKEAYEDYLRRVHMVKTIFDGSIIQERKK